MSVKFNIETEYANLPKAEIAKMEGNSRKGETRRARCHRFAGLPLRHSHLEVSLVVEEV